jgi:ribosome-binding protein aMBF1 (putative translation factor)
MILTTDQVRAARKLLGWSSVKTAVRSSVGENLIKRFEGDRCEPSQEMLNRLQSALEAAGRWSVYVRFTTQAALAFPDWPLSRAAISVAGTALLNKYP